MEKDCAAKLEARLCGDLAVLLKLLEHAAVVAGRNHHGHVSIIFGRGTQHGRAADVDVLDCVLEGAPLSGHGLLKGIEVHDHQVDGLDAVLFHLLHMFRIAAPAEDPAMHLGVQGLDPAVEHLGESREFRHILDLDPGIAKHLCRSARGQDLNAEFLDPLGEVENAFLV
jgi:hypothetical protein